MLRPPGQHPDVGDAAQVSRVEAADDAAADDTDPLDAHLAAPVGRRRAVLGRSGRGTILESALLSVTSLDSVASFPCQCHVVNAGELAELRVGDEALLPGAEPFTAASSSAALGRDVEPGASTFSRIESSPLFLPSTIRRSAPTSSDAYGSIAGGSWNWLATASLSRV